MIIGIFGDSFATKWTWRPQGTPADQPAWYEQLGQNHTVQTHSEPGAGLWWTWREFQKYHKDYERCIVVATAPNRLAIEPVADRWWRHVGPGWVNQVLNTGTITDDKELELLKSLEAWFTHVDQNYVSDVHNLLLDNMRSLRDSSSLTILPCFNESRRPPHETSLYNISQAEIDHYKIKEKHANPWFYDVRTCHLSRENNRILAKKIRDWLEYHRPVRLRAEDFETKPTAPESDYFDYSRTGGVAI
jgi:hypothetical protein